MKYNNVAFDRMHGIGCLFLVDDIEKEETGIYEFWTVQDSFLMEALYCIK